jgi:hypothetical protein
VLKQSVELIFIGTYLLKQFKYICELTFGKICLVNDPSRIFVRFFVAKRDANIPHYFHPTNMGMA